MQEKIQMEKVDGVEAPEASQTEPRVSRQQLRRRQQIIEKMARVPKFKHGQKSKDKSYQVRRVEHVKPVGRYPLPKVSGGPEEPVRGFDGVVLQELAGGEDET